MARTQRDRNIDTQAHLVNDIDRTFSDAIFYHQPFRTILGKLSARVWQNDAYRTLPMYMREYIDGYKAAKWKELEHYHLDNLVLYRGEWVALRGDHTRVDGFWAEVSTKENTGASFWRGTDVMYNRYDANGVNITEEK